MDLFLVRHAIAFEPDARRWPDDRDRPLTQAGEDKFRRAARGLKRLMPTIDVALSSPLIRARQTAQILTEEAGWPSHVECDELEPDRRPAEVMDVLRANLGGVVGLVGHDPYLSELVAYLLTGSEEGASVEMRKGGVARLALDEPTPGRAVLRWFFPPKVARAIRG